METLKKYAEEKWRARIKTVKGHKYIIIRLRKKDKSLGPYNLELWKKLETLGMTSTTTRKHASTESLENSLANCQKQISQLKRRQSQLASRIERWKKYPQAELIKFRKRLNKLEDASSKKRVGKWISAKNIIYIWELEEEKSIYTLVEYLDKKSTRINDKMSSITKASDQNLEYIKTLGRKWTISDFIEKLTCDDCNNEKYFSIQFLCNECNKIKWFGFVRNKIND